MYLKGILKTRDQWLSFKVKSGKKWSTLPPPMAKWAMTNASLGSFNHQPFKGYESIFKTSMFALDCP